MTSDSDWTDSDDDKEKKVETDTNNSTFTPEKEELMKQPIKRKVAELFGNDSSSDDEMKIVDKSNSNQDGDIKPLTESPDKSIDTSYKSSIFAGESENTPLIETKKEIMNDIEPTITATQEADKFIQRYKRPSRDMELSIPLINNILEDQRQPFLLKLPKFLFVDSKPFNKSTYEMNSSITNSSDLHLNIFNTMRWKYISDGQVHSMLDPKMTNTRLIRWSDGSYTIKIGHEQFPVSLQTTSNRPTKYIGVTHQSCGIVRTQTAFKGVLNVKPPNISSKTHQWLTEAVKDKYQYSKKTKITVTECDPAERTRIAEKYVQDSFKAQKKLLARRDRDTSRYENKYSSDEVQNNRHLSKNIRYSFLPENEEETGDYDDDDEDDEEEFDGNMDENQDNKNNDEVDISTKPARSKNVDVEDNLASDEDVIVNDDEPDELERLENLLEERERHDKKSKISAENGDEDEDEAE